MIELVSNYFLYKNAMFKFVLKYVIMLTDLNKKLYNHETYIFKEIIFLVNTALILHGGPKPLGFDD